MRVQLTSVKKAYKPEKMVSKLVKMPYPVEMTVEMKMMMQKPEMMMLQMMTVEMKMMQKPEMMMLQMMTLEMKMMLLTLKKVEMKKVEMKKMQVKMQLMMKEIVCS